MIIRINYQKTMLIIIGIIFLLSPSIFCAEERIYSAILKEERIYSVSLPNGYEASQKTYPVLYVLDSKGGNNFNRTRTLLNNLFSHETAPQMILVGIWNKIRNRDMIPAAVAHRPGSGGSKKFLGFIKEELMPYINNNYRTQAFSILYGMSNSALFTVYALLEKPLTFTAYIASSPMIGHCPEFINNKAREFLEKDIPTKRLLYIIYGNEDSGRVTEYAPNFKEYLTKYVPNKINIRLDILNGEGHVPDSSLSRGIKFVFSRD